MFQDKEILCFVS